jgi:ubiquitin C-terminal hydrolase
MTHAFGGRDQHDAGEFLIYILQLISDETNDKRNVEEERLTEEETDEREQRERSLTDLAVAQAFMTRLQEYENSFIVRNMFPHIMYRRTCKDPRCNYVARRIGHQPDLSLTFTQLTPKTVSLVDLLRHDYGPQSEEEVDSTCVKCKRDGRGEKGHNILRNELCYLPEYLVITLMRYYQDPKTGETVKLHTKITFPEKGIDMSDCFFDAKGAKRDDLPGHQLRPVYECYAAIAHRGFTPKSGHWFTYARSLDKEAKNGKGPGAWHSYNDMKVEDMVFSDMELDKVAVIFLRRQNAHI